MGADFLEKIKERVSHRKKKKKIFSFRNRHSGEVAVAPRRLPYTGPAAEQSPSAGMPCV